MADQQTTHPWPPKPPSKSGLAPGDGSVIFWRTVIPLAVVVGGGALMLLWLAKEATTHG